MLIGVTGASGFLGSALVSELELRGHRVLRFVRHKPGEYESQWDATTGTIDIDAVNKLDAVVHLAGENLGAKRWNGRQKARIRQSRIISTEFLSDALAQHPTSITFISASAMGYYGDGGETELTEQSPPGQDFLSRLCVDWELATRSAKVAGARVVNLRSGIVLDPHGGLLKRLVLPFKLGLGGRFGNGQQWMSWITRADWVSAVIAILENDGYVGPINMVTPHPVRNREFTKALGAALHRPTILPTPKFPLKLRYGGELVHALMLAGQRVKPAVLEKSGFEYSDPELHEALDRMFRRPRR